MLIFAALSVGGEICASVIVPAYRATATLERCVRSLLAQRFDAGFEVIVVASADAEPELPALANDARLTVVARVPCVPAAVARNLGAGLARGRVLVFADADVVASADWLQRLHDASADAACVAGAVANGTPNSVAGTVEYLVEFFDLSPARREPSEHGATCNLLVPRSLWEEQGPFPETMDGCEDTWLTTRLLAAGRLRFEPAAVVSHLNRRRMRSVLRHQYALGGSHARLASWQGTLPEAPVRAGVMVTVGRIRYLYRQLRRWQAPERFRAVALAPLAVAGFSAWGAGLISESRRLRRRGRLCG
jgi:glycosyltransferase involved in cell wall biosynthesis